MKKINNKILLVIVLIFIGILMTYKYYQSPKLESNFESLLLSLDTARITKVLINPAADTNSLVKLERKNDTWVLVGGNKEYEVDLLYVKRCLEAFNFLEAEKLVTRSKAKWNTYNVADSSTEVSAYSGNELLVKMYVGNIGFNKDASGQYHGDIFSYVRLDGMEEVYSVKGFLSPNFNKKIFEWRDKTFMRFETNAVTQVNFDYPGDSSFILVKKDTTWWVNGRKADFSKVDDYLFLLGNKDIYMISDTASISDNLLYNVSFLGDTVEFGRIEAWRNETGWNLKSSTREEPYFSITNDENDIIVGAGYFLPI
ncbi:MAG: DUF4340 domain-containing protein [Cyclobacteriaceae bacterium]|nr:DUF4340 domain-containing protein [Cyclobacteriaceae bacterium]